MNEKLNFLDVLEQAEEKYKSKLPKYGESWKTMPIDKLRERLNQEYSEWSNCSDDTEFSELLDIINLACMVARRLGGEKKK